MMWWAERPSTLLRAASLGPVKRTPLFVLAAVFGISAAFAIWWLIPADLVTEAGCDQIQVGMTAQEVEAILGRPADRLRHDAVNDDDIVMTWMGSRAEVDLTFDSNGRVCDKYSVPAFPGGWWGEFLRLLGLGPVRVEA
jgi:SmpA / OmlA family